MIRSRRERAEWRISRIVASSSTTRTRFAPGIERECTRMSSRRRARPRAIFLSWRQDRFELFRGQRTAVEESLNRFAMLFSQEFELLFRLYTLGHNMQLQRAGHRDDRGDDRPVIRTQRQVMH